MNTDTQSDSDRLHSALIDLLLDRAVVTSPRVEAALRAIPRHPFVPGASLADAYAPDDAVVTKRDATGAALSSASAPRVVAAMLEQLDVQPGDRVLEIGAGTGYNAALLAELAGPEGHVTTIDLDQDVVDGARAALIATGYDRVRVLRGDGALGHPTGVPYNRIVVTAGAWDLPPAWWRQLHPAGRLVVPLRITSGTSRSVAFDRDGDHLTSQSMVNCGFLAMRGVGAWPETTVALADGVTLMLSDGHTATGPSIAHVLGRPSTNVWSPTTLRSGRSFTDLDLWLATTAGDRFCRITVQPRAIESGLATPAFRWGGAALTDHTGSLAYLTSRAAPQQEDRALLQLGVRAHGPDGDELTAALLEQIRRWDVDHRGTAPRLHAYLKPSEPPTTATVVIDKPDTRLAVVW